MSGATTASYLYDANLKRVKTVAGGATTYSAYSRVTGGLIFRDELASATLTDYVSAGGASLRLKRQQQTTTPEYVHADALGSPVAATNAGGTVTWRESYTPFGDIRLAPPANDNSTGFTGHLRDKNTSLVYMQARLYDPTIGRFLSTDPIGYQDQLNLYAYVANDPVNKIDPTGMQGAPDFIQDQRNAALASFAKDNPAVAVAAGAVVAVAAAAEIGAIALANPVAATEIAVSLGEMAMGDAAGAGLGLTAGAGALAVRATDIHSALDPIAQSMRTTAVAETAEGGRFVASSENSLSRAQQGALQPGETAAAGPGHAEMTAVRAAEAAGQTPVAVGASRPICEDCMAQLRDRGIED